MGRVRSAIRWRGLWALPRTLLRGSLRREARQSLIALMRPSCVCATNSLTGGRAVKVNEGGSFHLLVALRHQTWCRAVFIAGISGIGEYPRTYRQAAGNITVGKPPGDRKARKSVV